MLEDFRSGKSVIPFYLAIILPLFTGISASAANIISMIELLILIYYFRTDMFFALTPIYYIYYSQLLLVGNRIALYTVYCGICVVRMLYLTRYLPKKDAFFSAPMLLLLLYGSAVLAVAVSLWNGLILAVQSIALFYSVICIKEQPGLSRLVKRILVVMCISAAIYGVMFVNIKGVYKEQTTLIQYGGRYSGTSGDPNYMAFYYCISMAFVLFDEEIPSVFKRGIVVALIAAIALTGSLTALSTVTLCMLLYIIVAKEQSRRAKAINVLLIVAAALAFVGFVMNDTSDIPLLNLYKSRIQEKLNYFVKGDVSNLTTGRTKYSGAYLSYLFSQNPLRMLFGGYQYNSMGLIGEAYHEIRFAAHNTYVDVLMTSGLVGLIVFVFIQLRNIIGPTLRWMRNRDQEEIGNAVYAAIVAFFIIGLSVFPSTCYMFFLML